LLRWRGFVAVAALAAHSAAGVVQAVLALAPVAVRPIAGRRVRGQDRCGDAAGSTRRALPG
jgi:hypothetical protein